MKTSVYIDGFNLYYRALKNTPFKWLDIGKMLSLLLDENHDIISIKYFTARVSGKIDARAPSRQQAYIRALEHVSSNLNVIYGHFLTHEVSMPLAEPAVPKTFVKVIKTEEKGSDVNMAVHIVNDAWKNVFDCAVLISNDSDIAEALRIIRYERNKRVGLLCPSIKGHPSKQLQAYAHFVKNI